MSIVARSKLLDAFGNDPNKIEEMRAAAVKESPATFEYVEHLANRNFKLITSFSNKVRLVLMGLVLSFSLGGIGVYYLLQEIKDTRTNGIIVACNEANKRHDKAAIFVAELVAKTPKPKEVPTKAQEKVQAEQVHLFLEAIAPKYDCRLRVKEFNKP